MSSEVWHLDKTCAEIEDIINEGNMVYIDREIIVVSEKNNTKVAPAEVEIHRLFLATTRHSEDEKILLTFTNPKVEHEYYNYYAIGKDSYLIRDEGAD